MSCPVVRSSRIPIQRCALLLWFLGCGAVELGRSDPQPLPFDTASVNPSSTVSSSAAEESTRPPTERGTRIDTADEAQPDTGIPNLFDTGTPTHGPTPDTGHSTPGIDTGGPGSTGSPVVVLAVGLPTPLPPFGTEGTTISLSSPVPAGRIVDLNVWIDIEHSCTQDLFAFLRSPSGSEILLFDLSSYPVCSANMEATVLDDEASFPLASGLAPFSGPHRPVSPLATFDGQDAEGVWTLTVEDGAPGDNGTLRAWALEAILR